MSNKSCNGQKDQEARSRQADEPCAFELDPAEYLPEMTEFDMTEAQKIEMLETLWSIMRAFVELGFTMDICGQFLQKVTEDEPDDSESVKSRHSPTTETLSKANGKDGSV